MAHVLQHEFGNASSLYDLGLRARDRIQWARRLVASTLHAQPREIVFTASGTEANNMAIIGTARRQKQIGKHIITSQIEHPSVLNTCRELEAEGYDLTYVPVDTDGRVCVDDVTNALRDETILVTIMAANNEVGTLQPLAEIGERLKQHQALFHTDAVQLFGKCPLDVDAIGADLVSVSAHKIYGPKGSGALYIRKGRRLAPIVFGGGQERGYRPGTENVPAIVGFGVAAKLAQRELETENERLTDLRRRLWQRLNSEIRDVTLNGHPTERLPHNLNVSFAQIEGQAIMLELNRKGIAVASSSACSAGKSEPSPVLLAMGKTTDQALQSIRLTLGRETTAHDVDRLVAEIKRAVSYFRSLLEG